MSTAFRETTPAPSIPAAAGTTQKPASSLTDTQSPAPASAATPTADKAAAPSASADGGVAKANDTKAVDNEPLPDEPDGIINMEIFSQIQDMDDDDDDDGDGGHGFSKGIVWGYFDQAEDTFKEMEEAIAEPSLSKLSSLGHFLKGSSAALGIIKVQNSCEKMQHYGNLRDEEVGAPLSEDEALKRIQQLLVDCKRDYAVASRWLKRLYGEEE